MRVPLLNRILNIGGQEWPRILLSWTISFFFRAGFVIGWTILISMFVNRIGIKELPLLFVTNALLIIAGTFLYSELLHRIRKEILIISTILCAGLFLFLASIFVYYSNLLFFGFFILTQAILITQLDILLSLFVEEFFSPLESQRALPLIESSEIIGAIAGGLIISLSIHFLPAYKFIYVWIILLFLIIPFIFSCWNYWQNLPSLKLRPEKEQKFRLTKKVQEGFKHIKKIPFLKYLLVVILCQGIFVNLVEFQYTKALQQSVLHQEEQTLAFSPSSEYLKASVLNTPDFETAPFSSETRSLHFTVSLKTGRNLQTYENDLAQKLGLFQVIFSVGSLLVQLLVTSRIISKLGVTGSLAIQPLISFFCLIGLTFKFNFLTAALTRGTFEITGKIFENSYQSSLYAVIRKIKDQVRETFEGLIRPIGAILATIFLFAAQALYIGPRLTFSINLIMFLVSFLMISFIARSQEKYTQLSLNNLNPELDYPTRIDAIEILGQKGHFGTILSLLKTLHRKNEKEIIKIKILESLGHLQNPATIPDILDCFECENENVRLSAVETLGKFKNLGKHFFSQAFSQYRVINALKDLFQKDPSKKVRSAIIRVLANLSQSEVISFLLQILEKGDPELKADSIYVAGLFHDPNAAYYLDPHLDHPDFNVRANAIVALWQFPKYRSRLEHYLKQMLASKKRNVLLAGIFVAGEIKLKKEKKRLISYLHSPNLEIRHQATLALAKMEHSYATAHLLEFILHENESIAEKTKQILKELSPGFKKTIEQLVHQKISERINNLLEKVPVKTLSEMKEDLLLELKKAYETVNAHHEVYQIAQILKEREKRL